MGIRVYVSGISGNKEVKKRQQRVTMILDSKNIQYSIIDIAEPGKESDKEFMQENSKTRDSKHPLPPQIFNGNHYCGDYEDFDMANELDELEKFLKTSAGDVIENGISNGSKIETVKADILKEDYHESSEETVSNVKHSGVEAVSLGNDAQSTPEEIPYEPDNISKSPDFDDTLINLDEHTNGSNEIPKLLNTCSNVDDEPKSLINDEDKNDDAEVDDKLYLSDSTDEE